ncbi:MAG: aminotransferase class I/II-fold pyridoxal phosphate-dependent enzyme [Aquihabitans sp.]
MTDAPPSPSNSAAPHPGLPAPALHQDTLAIRAGRRADGTSLAPVLYPTTTFSAATVDEARAMATKANSDRFYSRYGNPTVAAFQDAIAELEGAEAARAFASGMGAVSAVVLGLCSAGDHIVAQRQIYAATQLLFQAVCPRFGIDVTFVDGTEPGAFAAAVRPGKTTLVFAETPANPKLDVIDLDALGAIAGPMTVVDGTFAPPVIQRPLSHGVDLVLHSATKGIGGHNDATIGVVAGSDELIQWLWGFAVLQGAPASPYDALNAIRGIRTLSVRVERQSKSALVLATSLEARSDVAEVRYPGLASHPQHELAMRQMSSGGGLVTFDVVGGLEGGRRFVEAVRVAQLATSLGGPETLVTHPATTTHVNLLPAELAANGIGPGTIRVSVGLEHVDDLVADFAQALDRSAV